MVTFGIIAEGPTDIAVIQNILAGYFNNPDIELNPLQPPLDQTDKVQKGVFGGWLQVFTYLETEAFENAFYANDYIIIQLDTDVCDQYGITNRKRLSLEDLIDQVIAKIKEKMGNDLYDYRKNQIIYAIAVHSLECWLLPLHAKEKKDCSRINNCQKTLAKYLCKKGIIDKQTCDDTRYKRYKNYKNYSDISKEYTKNKVLIKLSKSNPSLEVFVNNLKAKNIVINKDV